MALKVEIFNKKRSNLKIELSAWNRLYRQNSKKVYAMKGGNNAKSSIIKNRTMQ